MNTDQQQLRRIYVRPEAVSGHPTTIEASSEYNPAEGYTTEFSNLTTIWHEKSEQPDLKKFDLFICWHEDARAAFITTKSFDPDMSWERFCEVFNVWRWAYCTDLLPEVMTIKTEDDD